MQEMIQVRCEECETVFGTLDRSISAIEMNAQMNGWLTISINNEYHDFCSPSCLKEFMSENDLAEVK